MKKIIVFALILSLIAISVVAEANFTEAAGVALLELEGQTIPKPVNKFFGNEQVNIHIELENSKQIIVGLITENDVVKSASFQTVEKPSLNVYTSETTIKEILSAKNPVKTLKKSMDDKKVKYKAVGLLNKIKFGFLSVFSNIASLFESTEVVDDPINDNSKLPVKASEKAKEVVDEKLGKEAEIESAEIETVEVEKTTVEETEKEIGSSLTGDIVAEVKPESKIHVVSMDSEGFTPKEITVGVGDTVVWENNRDGQAINKAMVIGVRTCGKVKSKFFLPGESFSWTFDEAGECIFVDGIMTTKDSKVIIAG